MSDAAKRTGPGLLPSGSTFNRRAALTAALTLAGATALSSTVLPVLPAFAQGKPRITTMRVGNRPGPIKVNSRTNRVYVINTRAGTLSVVDGFSRAVLATVTVGLGASNLAINEATNQVYIADSTVGAVSILNGVTNTIIGSVATAPGSSAMDIDEVTQDVYVSSNSTDTVQVLKRGKPTLSTSIKGPTRGFAGISIDPGRRLAYLSSVHTSSVEILDLKTGAFVGSIGVGKGPAGLGVHRVSNTVYVSNSGIHHLSVLDGATRTERATIRLRSQASSLAVHQRSNTVYTNGGPNGIVKTDGAQGKLSGELSLGINPGSIAVNQVTKTVYVTDPLHHVVFAITDF